MKKSILATSIAIGMLSLTAGQSVWAADDAALAKLQEKIDALQQQVTALQQQKTTVAAASVTASADTSGAAAGDDSTRPVTQSELAGFRTDLENYKYDDGRQYERKTTKSTRDTTLYGTVQVRAQGQSTSTIAGNPASSATPRYSTFDVPTALIGVRGNLYKDYKDGKNLDYQLSFTYAKRAGTTDNLSDLSLADAFLRYNFFSTNGDLEIPKLNLTFGQQLLPFGIDPQATEDLRPTINVAYGLSQLGLFGRQDGLILRGDVKPYVDYGANYRAPLFEYALGVTNGNGANKLANENGKQVVGRVAFTLPVDYSSVFRELKLGASYIKGTKNVTKNSAVIGTGRNDRLGLDVYYNHAPFGVTYEYVQGNSEFAKQTGGGTTDVKAKGQTLTLFYTIGDQFYNSIKSAGKFDDYWPQSIQTFYRYDTYNPNKGVAVYNDNSASVIAGNSQGKVTIHTLGLNFFFAETTKFQLGINHWDYAYKTATQKDFNEAQAQFQYTF